MNVGCVLVLPEEYDTTSEPEEKETAAADISQDYSIENAQSTPAMLTQAAARRSTPAHGMIPEINTSSAVKRSLEESAGS
ncbi:hypothetical protein MRX96_032294 [Rhipicephalus microplus]